MISIRELRILTVFQLAIILFIPGGLARPASTAVITGESDEPPTIIFGFLGGFIRHDDSVHYEVQVASRLRSEYPTGTVVETFENHNAENAYQRILNLLDINHDGTLSAEEKHNARIVLYGHSWGASELVTLARRLDGDGIPVMLTIQVDSVAKFGENDQMIPANVAEAVNYYQTDGWLHGESQIRAEDKTRTRIIGNFRFSYASIPYNCTDYPWYARAFMKAHTQIECDSRVWNQVESLIRSILSLPVRRKKAAQ